MIRYAFAGRQVFVHRYKDWYGRAVVASEEERNRALEMRRGSEFLIRRTALREIVGADARIEHTRLGKPYVAGGPEFSLSTSGQVFAIAVGPGVGVDVERVREAVREGDDVIDFEALARDHFTAVERRRLDPDRFFRTWTRREAAAKSLGAGIGDSLADVDLARFRLRSWRPFPDYWLSVAVPR